jgi:glutathione S-transferase
VLTLYQAEWCPYSAAVRQRLTELGVDVVVRQVAPTEDNRDEVDEIPTLELDDGRRLAGSEAVLAYLAGLSPGPFEREHRAEWLRHASARGSTAALLDEHAPLGFRA